MLKKIKDEYITKSYHKESSKELSALLSSSWGGGVSSMFGTEHWLDFIQGNKDKIVSKRGQKYKLNQQNWTTSNHFVKMYNHIIEELVNAEVTEWLDTPVQMDCNVNLCTKKEAHRYNLHHRIVRPDLYTCPFSGTCSSSKLLCIPLNTISFFIQ